MTIGVISKLVLIIDDSPTQAIHLQAIIEQIGAKVVCATNGHRGLYMAKNLHPDMIVLDINMPDMNGFEVCKLLRSSPETINIPIILFTVNDTQEAVKLGMEYGVIDFIPKDAFADAVLLETLRQMGFVNHDN
jgi:PleD family two-component response regulator